MELSARGRSRLFAGLIRLTVIATFAAVVLLILRKPEEQDSGTQPAATPTALLSRTPVALAPGVYLLGRTAPAAAYAVDTSAGLVLVDSGLEASASSVTAQLEELNLDVGRLRAILLTHVHADHSLGAQRLRSLTGAKVYAGRPDCPPLRAGTSRDAFFSTFYMPDVATHATNVDVELADDEVITMGDARFTAIATPGHTPGSVCYLLERGELRVLFTGDVIQSLDLANEGALGTYAAHLPPVYRGNATEYLASLRRLRALPVPTLVLPGHPQMDARPHSAALSREEWERLLDKGIREMELLLKRREADGANFLDGTPRELLSGLHYLGDHRGSAVYCLVTKDNLFVFDAPGDGEVVNFLKERFKERGWEGRKLTAVLLTSGDSRATAGLAGLVRATNCQVVAPKAHVDAIRTLCPDGTVVLTETDLEKRNWLDVRVIRLGGRGTAPVGYFLRWSGKTVIIPGCIPTKLSVPATRALMSDVSSRSEYLEALDRLGAQSPDLWLPAVPVHGQNANLYDRDWSQVIDANRRVFLY